MTILDAYTRRTLLPESMAMYMHALVPEGSSVIFIPDWIIEAIQDDLLDEAIKNSWNATENLHLTRIIRKILKTPTAADLKTHAELIMRQVENCECFPRPQMSKH